MGLELLELWAVAVGDARCRLFPPISDASNDHRLKARRRRLQLLHHLLQPRSRHAQHLQHYLHAHGQWEPAGLSSGYRPGRRRLGAAKARTTTLTGMNPIIYFISASDRAEWDYIIGASI